MTDIPHTAIVRGVDSRPRRREPLIGETRG